MRKSGRFAYLVATSSSRPKLPRHISFIIAHQPPNPAFPRIFSAFPRFLMAKTPVLVLLRVSRVKLGAGSGQIPLCDAARQCRRVIKYDQIRTKALTFRGAVFILFMISNFICLLLPLTP